MLANGFYGPGWEDASKAKKLMRHKKLETTLVYYHVLDETVEEKARQSKAMTNPDDFDDFEGGSPVSGGATQPPQRPRGELTHRNHPLKEKERPGTDRPFWKFAGLATSLLVGWPRGCEYVAFTTTDFVWISSTRLDGGLIQPLLLCATRFGAMHSPSGSLLTPRVSFWTHWRSFDRHVPCAVVVSLDLKVSRYRRFA